jgi:demethylmenaquinone methyltransferase / 2-methoxy-6-polyprenyl-1,4-benzoquinol methylase
LNLSTYYEPGRERAAKVRELFNRIARRYDLLNDLQSFGLHRLWKRRMIRLCGVGPGVAALDVCCGTGDIALALARRGAEVTGLDFSEEMLAVARRKASSPAAKGMKSARFIQGDAQQLPFSNESFEVVTVGYGLRNLAELDAGLREMARVLKPGGRLLALDFGKPENRLWRGIYFGYLRCFVPLLGLLFCGSAGAYSYILESLKHYPAQEGVASRMRGLGLENVRVWNFLGGVMSIHRGEKPSGFDAKPR